MKLVNIFIIISSRIVVTVISALGLGAASAWPGRIARFLNKNFIKQMLADSHVKIILIAGTNGKTTTSALLAHILEKQGVKVFQNVEGSNLLNGIASSIIKHSDFMGKINYDCICFEVDENILPHILKLCQPQAIILLNLFRDQLDRYGEVNSIARKWTESLKIINKSTHLILNGDDPEIYFLGKNVHANVSYFGLSQQLLTKKEIPHDVDSIYCPQCGEKLVYEGISYSHLGNFHCAKCDFKRENIETFEHEELPYPLLGVYNIYNTNAVVLTVQKTFEFSLNSIKDSLQSFKPAFGRQEVITYKGRNIFMLLSKNPTGFNQSMSVVTENFGKKKHTIVVILNDRIPDGTDVSWIWDADFEELLPQAEHLIVSGDRAYDMGIRFAYALENHTPVTMSENQAIFAQVEVIEELAAAIKKAVEYTPEGEDLIILPTYSAMLDTRKILSGRKLL